MSKIALCPDCGKLISLAFPFHDCRKPNPHAQALGRLGGKAGKGKVKARTTEQARAAVMVRWNKVKAQQINKQQENNTL